MASNKTGIRYWFSSLALQQQIINAWSSEAAKRSCLIEDMRVYHMAGHSIYELISSPLGQDGLNNLTLPGAHLSK